ncbi:MAG: hypothetical protein GY869_01775 [Planctomycetes bacterium]|nr:hypothetical protein [Planctomycetota bacterium]
MIAKNANTPKPIRKKRRWLRRLVIFLVLMVFILTGAAPGLLSTRYGTSLLVNAANNRSETPIELDELSLSWRGPMLAKGLTVWDKEGRESIKLEKATLVRNLFDLINSPGNFGELILEGLQVTAYPAAEDQEIKPIIWNGPRPYGNIVIQSGQLQFVQPDGAVEELAKIDGELTINTFDDIQGELLLSTLAGKVKADLKLHDLNTTGQLNPETLVCDVNITTEENLDLKKLLSLAQIPADLSGQLKLNVQANYQKDQLSTEILTEVSGMRDTRAEVTGTPPLDVSFVGQIETNQDQLIGSGELKSTAGTIQTKFNYPLSGRFDEILADNFLDILLKGSVVTMPEFSLEVEGSLDMPAISRVMPSVLKVRDDILITQGTLRINKLAGHGGIAPQLTGSMQLVDLIASQGETLLAIEPITVDYDMRLESGIGLHIRQGEIKSEFVQLSAAGTIGNITGDFVADLSQLHRQMSEIFDMSTFNLAGAADGTFNLRRSGPSDIHIDLAFKGRTLLYQTNDHQWDFPQLNLNYQGSLNIADYRPQRMDGIVAKLDLGGYGAAQYTGSYNFADGGVHGTLDLVRTDLAWLARQIPAEQNPNLSRYAGSISLKASVDRAANEAVLISTGDMRLQGMTVDNQPLSNQEIGIFWSDMQVDPALEYIDVAGGQINSDLINLNADNLHYQIYPVRSADGQVELRADLKRLADASELIFQKQYPENLTGQFMWTGTCRTTDSVVSLTGAGQINNLQIGAGPTAFRDNRIDLIHDTEMDRQSQVIQLKQTEFSSSILSAQLEGTVSDYNSTALVDLKGNYEGSWDNITKVLHGLFPQSVEVVNMEGATGGEFQITGAAYQKDLQPPFYDLKSDLLVNWDSAQFYGIQLGPAQFSPQLKEGQIVLPLTSIAAQNGKLNIQGFVDLRQPEPIWSFPEPIMVLDEFPVNEQTGKQLLSYVNPIFAQMTRMSGLASLELSELEIPLSENYQNNIKARGTLSIADMQVQTEGALDAIQRLMGMQKQVTQPMKVENASFEIKNGRIYYDDFRVTIARVYDMRFYGSVGFDDSLDLKVSLPVVPAMLENLGIENPINDLAKIITGARIDIPIVGTRTKPVLDMSGVDLAPILQKTVKDPVKGIQNAVENIFKIIRNP